MTRNRDVSAVQNNLGVAIPPAAAGKNAVINGGLEIWQRGTSFTTTGGLAYTADRWISRTAGAGGSMVTTRDTSVPTGFQYSAKVRRSTSNTDTNALQFTQSFETVNSLPFAGKTVTLSFYAKAGANFSSSSSVLSSNIMTGTGTDEVYYSYTGSTNNIQSNTLTTSWQRFTQTVSIPSNVTEISVMFYWSPTGTAGADDSFFVTGVQLELGSSATPFSRNGSSIQGELAACQRYYYRVTGQSAGQSITNGNNESTTVATAFMPFPVTMRTAPTALEQDGTAANYYVRHQATTTNCSSVPTFANGSKTGADISFIVASGLTAGNGNKIGMNSTSAYLGWSAEL